MLNALANPSVSVCSYSSDRKSLKFILPYFILCNNKQSMSKHIKDNNDSKLLPSYERFTRSKIRGKAVECTVSMVPESISEKKTLYIRVPKLKQGACLVPGSLRLTAKLKNKNTKSWFLNNIAALLQREVRIKFNNQDVYHNTRESDFLLYRDLWQSKEGFNARVDEGIANENTRKLMSGDDSGSSSGSTQVVNDKLIADTYKDEIVIPLSRILENQGLFAPYGMDFNIDIEIKLPEANDIMQAQASQTVAGYELKSLQHDCKSQSKCPKTFHERDHHAVQQRRKGF